MVRKMAINSTPTLHITQDGDKFSTKLESMVHTKVNEFTIGQEFEEAQPTGDVMKVSSHKLFTSIRDASVRGSNGAD